MVAYTSNYCLPCLEGSDSPCLNTGTVCEPSNVWCDLVNIVETQLNSMDSVIARTQAAIPLASVTGNTAETFSPATVIWDTVEYDTDNMVNLSADATAIIPTRSGLYMAFGRIISAVPGGTPVDGFEHRLVVSSGTDFVEYAGVEVTAAVGSMYLTAKKIFPWTLGVSPGFTMEADIPVLPPLSARMSIWWVSDL
jgi:hypothetical protein